MLSALFSNNLKPLANPAVAALCQTLQGLRSVCSSLLRSARNNGVVPTSTIRVPEADVRSTRLDCLLLVGCEQYLPKQKVRQWQIVVHKYT